MKILIITNIPSPYRIDFFNELGKYTELTVVFEAEKASGIKFNWNVDQINNFNSVFLKEGNINEKKINWSILKYIKKNHYDQIIVTNYGYYTEMIALLALKLLGIPYFLEIDGGLIRKENKFKKIYKTFLISNATGYFSPSKISDEYLKHYGANKDLIYRYPFTSLKESDIANSTISVKEKQKIKSGLNIKETKIILGVGQFIYRKGFDILIEATKNLDNDIGVILVGGESTEEYTYLKEKYNLNNLYFEGFKSKEELAKYFKAADLFVLPTREDIWGLVINEAMAHGLPVITTDKCIAGLELVNNGENGYIITAEKPNLLAKKINYILKNKKLLNSMSNNSLKVVENFTIEKMVKKHLSVFNNKSY